MLTRPDPVLEALWKKVIDNWDDDATHTALLEYCQANGQLAEAAARYRGMTGDRLRGPSAEKRLQSVATLALLALETARSSPRELNRQAGAWILVVLFLAGTIAISIYLLRAGK